MQLNNKNTVTNESVDRLNSVLNDFYNCSDAAELTQKTFDFFYTIYDFNSVSIFLLDKKTFEFVHFQTEGKSNVETVLGYFETLVSNGTVAKAIDSESILKCEFILESKPCANILIKPLATVNEISGLLFFTNDCNHVIEEQVLNYIDMISKVFFLILKNFELIREVQKVKDDSERKITERTNDIVQSSMELKTILDYLHLGIFISDLSTGEIADVNLMGQRIVGLSKEEIIGKNRADFFYFRDSVDTTSQITSISENLLQKNGGDVIPVLHKATEIRLNQMQFLLDNFLDISERKAMELELQLAHDDLETRVIERTKELSDANLNLQLQIKERIKAEEEAMKLDWALHQSPTMIIITNLKGEIEYVNPSFVRITGYTLDEVLGKNPRLLKSGNLKSEKYKDLWEAISNGNDWKSEYENRKKSGEIYWVSATISPIKNHEGIITNYLSVQEDITAKKIAEQEILIAKERAEASSKFKTKLLATMSHEFRTPLISIFGFADILKDELHDGELVELVNEIGVASKRLLNTLNGVLLLSQLESMEEEINLEKMDVHYLVENLLAQHILCSEAKGLKLIYTKYVDPLFIRVDKNLFDQMVNSIIDNAIKYTVKGFVNVRIAKDEKNCFIEIEDTGIGIEKSQHELIFEAFKQVSEGYSRNYDGCGLGLALAKKIAESMDCSIYVKSEPSIGSTFTIKLPLI